MTYNLLLQGLLLHVALAQEPAPVLDTAPAVAPTPAPVPDAPPPVAAPPPVPVSTAPVEPSWMVVLEAAESLQKDGKTASARATVDWLLTQPVPPDVHERALTFQSTLPEASQVRPLLRLAVWQSALGAYVMGPNLQIDDFFGYEDTPYLIGALVGIGTGAGTAYLMKSAQGLSTEKVTTVMAAEQLGFANGLMLGDLTDGEDEDWGVPTGTFIGTLGGAGAGMALARRNPDPTVATAVLSGAWWGAALSIGAMTYTYYWERDLDNEVWYYAPAILGADLGALAGAEIARATGVSRQQLRMMNLGGAGAAFTAYGFAYLTHDVIWYTDRGVVAVIALSGVAGGALGIVLAGEMSHPPRDRGPTTAILSGEDGRIRVGTPLPMVAPSEKGPRWQLSLVDYRF